jgi:hypothetical protein
MAGCTFGGAGHAALRHGKKAQEMAKQRGGSLSRAARTTASMNPHIFLICGKNSTVGWL